MNFKFDNFPIFSVKSCVLTRHKVKVSPTTKCKTYKMKSFTRSLNRGVQSLLLSIILFSAAAILSEKNSTSVSAKRTRLAKTNFVNNVPSVFAARTLRAALAVREGESKKKHPENWREALKQNIERDGFNGKKFSNVQKIGINIAIEFWYLLAWFPTMVFLLFILPSGYGGDLSFLWKFAISIMFLGTLDQAMVVQFEEK